MRHNDSEPSYSAARTGVRVPAAKTVAERERRRTFKRLRLHRQFIPLLVLVTLLSTAGISGLAYLGSRSAALSNAQTRAAQDAQVLHDELAAYGAPLRLSDGRFVVGTGTTTLTLNDDTTIVDHARTLLGDDTSIYELEGQRLVAISTNLPAAGSHGDPPSGARDLGDVLPTGVTSAVLGSCGPSASPPCYHSYDGVVSLASRQYVVDVVPLFDATGAFVGAVSAALPLDVILAPTVQLSVVLLMVGALLALVSLAAGIWVYGARVETVLDHLDSRLNRLADAAGNLEHLAHRQVDHSARQSSLARQIAEQVRALDAMAQVMEQGHATLRDSTSEIWAEISQPGIAPGLTAAGRLAQQTAVVSARVGSAAEDARDLCRQLVVQMNHIVAEAGIVTDSGRALEQRAQDLRTCVEGVEMTLGERLCQRMFGSSLPMIRHVRAASQHLRGLLPGWAATANGAPTGSQDKGALQASLVDQPDERRGAGSLWSWQDEQDDSVRRESTQQQQQQRQLPIAPSSNVWPRSTGRHITPRMSGASGTPRARGQRSAASSSDILPSASGDALRGDPAASLPRSPRFRSDPGSSGDDWKHPRPEISSWLDE